MINIFSIITFIFSCIFYSSASAVNLPIQTMTISNVRILLVENHQLPLLRIRMAWQGGAANTKPSIAKLTSFLLTEGAGNLDQGAFHKKLNQHAITINFTATQDRLYGNLDCLSQYKSVGFSLLKDALTTPHFKSHILQQKKKLLLAILQQKQSDPGQVANRAWHKAAFLSHPYALPIEGTKNSIQKADTTDIQIYHKQVIAKNNLFIAVYGDINKAELRKQITPLLAALPQESMISPVTNVKFPEQGKYIHIEHPTPQTKLFFGHRGIGYHHPDFYGAYLINTLLSGGHFFSRLTEEIREKRGLSYGVSAHLYPLEHTTSWLGNAASHPDGIRKIQQIIQTEMQRIIEHGVTEKELQQAKQYLTGSYQLRFSSGAEVVNQLLRIQIHNLGEDFFQKRNTYIQAINTKDIQRIARSFLQPEKLITVTVGKGYMKK